MQISQGLLDKYGKPNDKTPPGWRSAYYDLSDTKAGETAMEVENMSTEKVCVNVHVAFLLNIFYFVQLEKCL